MVLCPGQLGPLVVKQEIQGEQALVHLLDFRLETRVTRKIESGQERFGHGERSRERKVHWKYRLECAYIKQHS